MTAGGFVGQAYHRGENRAQKKRGKKEEISRSLYNAAPRRGIQKEQGTAAENGEANQAATRRVNHEGFKKINGCRISLKKIAIEGAAEEASRVRPENGATERCVVQRRRGEAKKNQR